MVSTDPLADMFSRIRNASAVNKPQISLPHSKLKESVAKILVQNGFIKKVEVVDGKPQKTMDVVIADENSPSTITEISRLSKPGRRVYVKSTEIPVVKRGRGIVIVSTSKGVMTGQEAKDKRLGGELIGEVY